MTLTLYFHSCFYVPCIWKSCGGLAIHKQALKEDISLEERYTVDGELFFDTRMALNVYLEEEERMKAEADGRKKVFEEEVR